MLFSSVEFIFGFFPLTVLVRHVPIVHSDGGRHQRWHDLQ